jgi:hypothetical protein
VTVAFRDRFPTAYYGCLMPAVVGFYFAFGLFLALLAILPFFDLAPRDLRIILRAQVRSAEQTLNEKGR